MTKRTRTRTPRPTDITTQPETPTAADILEELERALIEIERARRIILINPTHADAARDILKRIPFGNIHEIHPDPNVPDDRLFVVSPTAPLARQPMTAPSPERVRRANGTRLPHPGNPAPPTED